jgi:hypothetical protein
MEPEKPKEPVQLGEEDLRNARKASAQIEESLRVLSAIAQRSLGRDTEAYTSQQKQKESGFKNEFVIFSPGSSKQIHSNPPDGPCYVMIDPPGITRECDLSESTTCHAVDDMVETLKR